MATILVIDDDEAMVDFLACGLKQAGHKVFSAANPAAGTAIAEREKPDLITIDFCMPGGDGGKALQSLRGSNVAAATPVIFISSIAPGIIKTSIPNAVNVRFLPKPPNLPLLEALIAEMLASPPPSPPSSPAAAPVGGVPPVDRTPVAASAAGSADYLRKAAQLWTRIRSDRPTLDRKTLARFGAAAVAGLAVAAGVWSFELKPKMRLNKIRYESTLDVARLYGLQLKYKKATGIYANDLGPLLALAPDGDALKANLLANVDLNTLAVVGDARRFKIEINVLDGDRTPIKVTGPNPGRHPAAVPAAVPEATPVSADGAPINPLGR